MNFLKIAAPIAILVLIAADVWLVRKFREELWKAIRQNAEDYLAELEKQENSRIKPQE